MSINLKLGKKSRNEMDMIQPFKKVGKRMIRSDKFERLYGKFEDVTKPRVGEKTELDFDKMNNDKEGYKSKYFSWRKP